ncbi:MAG: hypothetical protein RMI50_01385 [Aquificaceae bacterium]|nr:hypothetical protein [Aquificaceae bacterium]
MEKLERCQEELEKLTSEGQFLRKELRKLEEEKALLKERIEHLTEYIGNIESISKSKDEMIRSLTEETRVYRKLLLVLITFMFLLLFLIVFLSVK